MSTRSSLGTRGFIFPFVLFFVFAGVIIVSQIYLYTVSQNDYDTFSILENQANSGLENQVSVFKNILAKTNANGSGTGAGSDNDDYLLSGSGGVGTDDDTDAFAHRFGTLSPTESRNILAIDSAYLTYSTGFVLSTLGNISLTLDATGAITLSKLDTSGHIVSQKTMSGSVWVNTIDPTGFNTGDSMALFLGNPSSSSGLSYTLSANNTSGQKLWNLIGAKNLGNGKYAYYSNILLPDQNGRYMIFAKVFTN